MNNEALKVFLLVTLICTVSACFKGSQSSGDFVSFGVFSVKHCADGTVIVKDGIGRKFRLVPRSGGVNFNKRGSVREIPVPVRRLVAYSTLDVAYLRALGALDVLVGVKKKRDEWIIPQVRDGMASGKIAYVGEPHSIDFEKIAAQKPDLVLTWDPSIVPVMDKLGIPCVVTTSGTAMNLESRIHFMEFLAVFVGKEAEARRVVRRIEGKISAVRERISGVSYTPGVIWGDVYEKRVLVEPGNSWVAEVVRIAGGRYLFDDIRGAS